MILTKYETILIIDNVLPKAEIDKTIKKYTGILTKWNDSVKSTSIPDDIEVEQLGYKELAYAISGRKRGYYVIFKYWSQRDNISELDRLLRIDDNILKFITVNIDGNVTEVNADNIINNTEKSEQKKIKIDCLAVLLGDNNYIKEIN